MQVVWKANIYLGVDDSNTLFKTGLCNKPTDEVILTHVCQAIRALQCTSGHMLISKTLTLLSTDRCLSWMSSRALTVGLH